MIEITLTVVKSTNWNRKWKWTPKIIFIKYSFPLHLSPNGIFPPMTFCKSHCILHQALYALLSTNNINLSHVSLFSISFFLYCHCDAIFVQTFRSENAWEKQFDSTLFYELITQFVILSRRFVIKKEKISFHTFFVTNFSINWTDNFLRVYQICVFITEK